MADYRPQGYSNVVDRARDVAYGIGDYASDIFARVSDAIFGPPMELAPVYDEKMVPNEYSRLLGGGTDLRGDYGGLERGLGSRFNFRQANWDSKKGNKKGLKYQGADRKSTGGKVGVEKGKRK